MTFNEMVKDPMDRAIARRLASIGKMPIESERLDRAMTLLIAKAPTYFWRRGVQLILSATLGVLIATAAFGSLLLVIVSTARLLPSRQTFLSPSKIAEMHDDMVADNIPSYPVKSVDEANRTIAAMAGDFPRLPDLPDAQAIKCSLRTINGKPVAGLLLNFGGMQVTLMVAPDSDVAMPQGATVQYDGRRYQFQTAGKLNMAMTEQSDRWVCLTAESPPEKLIEIAARLRF